MNLSPTVLLVEDEVEFGDVITEQLWANGYQVTVARDGVEGMTKILKQDFDVILCDLLMPNMAGDTFYAEVERIKPHLCPRFIFITADQSTPRLKDFLRRVGALTLFKPFTVSLLKDAMSVSLSKGSGEKK